MRSAATRLRWAIEPFHAVCYFAPDVTELFTMRGHHPWTAYFAQRSAPMGQASAETVTAAFFGFNTKLVQRAVPGVWDHLSPEDAWELRMTGVDTALRRLLGDWCDSAEVVEAAGLARSAADAVPIAGRPLGGPTAQRPSSGEPHVDLWVAATALRELRGDGHVAALVTHGVGPIESMVTSHGFSNLSQEFHRRNRGWDEVAWQTGLESAQHAGWVDESGALTDRGIELRKSVEAETDKSMEQATAALGPDGIERLITIVQPVSDVLTEQLLIGR